MTYQASWSDQREGAAFISAAKAQLDTELGDINRAVNVLISNWDGKAQQAYHDRQARWNQAGERIKMALDKFASGLSNAADISSGAERSNINIVSG